MAVERWNDERLDRLAQSVEANSRDIAANAQAISELRSNVAANAQAISELRSNIDSLLSVAQIHQQSLEVSQRQFDILVQEIRGLRSENRRILAHLFGEQSE